LSQPDIGEKAPVGSLSSTQENNVSSDESLSYSVEDIYQKIKELGLPEPANKNRMEDIIIRNKCDEYLFFRL
jgi:hypothetical protein